MPVENIHRDGTMMINKLPDGGVLADCVYVFPGDILEDEDFSAEDLKLIKDKDASVSKYWRYLTDAKANAKKKEKEELEELAAEAEEQTGPPLAEGSFEDSTGLAQRSAGE